MAFSRPSPTKDDSSTQNDSPSNDAQRIEIPARYAREIRERERLHEACPVDVFVAGINPRYTWPYRLVAANKACQSVVNSAETIIIDSVVNDPFYPIQDILDTAHNLDADFVIGKDWPPAVDPCDRLGNPGIHPADAFEYFTDQYEQHECNADVIVPVYPPFERTLGGLTTDWIDHYALGGMRDMTGEQQVAHVRTFRDIMGYEVTAHGLGMGTSLELINAIRSSIEEDPENSLLDSLDISTPETAVANNKIPTKRWHQQRVPFPTGDDSTTVRAGFSEAIARMLEFELTPKCDDELFETTNIMTFT